MEILVTNDDGYRAKGIRVLANIMRQFGRVTVIAPKSHQSGMSMAVSLGMRRIAFRELYSCDGFRECYLDATPASCIKFGLGTCLPGHEPDVIVSGINHGSNAASASCYSGTLGAALEGALHGIPSIGVSLDTMDPDADFSAVEKFFPDIFRKLMDNLPDRKGIIYNVNFPDLPAERIAGVRTGYQGRGIWVREFQAWDPEMCTRHALRRGLTQPAMLPEAEEGEEFYVMTGDFTDDPSNTGRADHRLMQSNFISVVPHNVDTTDYTEADRLKGMGLDTDFRL